MDDNTKNTKYYYNGDVMEEIIKQGNAHHIKISYHINNRINEVSYYENKKLHNTDDKPAYIRLDLEGNIVIKIYYKHGVCHRDNDEPAFIKYTSKGYIKELKYYHEGKLGFSNTTSFRNPTHIEYYKNSSSIKCIRYKSSEYSTYPFYNSNLPMNIMVDNCLIHRSGNKPGFIKYYKTGEIQIETYFNRGKVHRYEGYARIMYDKLGNILLANKYIDGREVLQSNDDYIKNWSKMFSKQIPSPK